MSAEERRARLREAIGRFVESVEELPEEAFLREVDGRSPRDIVAHLIGWNRYTIQAHEELRRGELPVCLADPGEDFAKVNALSIERYSSRDRDDLLAELRASAEELDRLLAALPPEELDDNYGVTWRGRPVTVAWLASAVRHDFEEHRREIEAWERTVKQA
jgi:hypothetical protein